MKYLLDTNIVIFILKNNNPQGLKAADRLESVEHDEIVSTSIVEAELYHGAAKYGIPERRRAAVKRFLNPYDRLPFDYFCASYHASIRHHLETKGNIIGGNDLMIAATALAHDLTVITHNSGEFSRVPGLKWEDWS